MPRQELEYLGHPVPTRNEGDGNGCGGVLGRHPVPTRNEVVRWAALPYAASFDRTRLSAMPHMVRPTAASSKRQAVGLRKSGARMRAPYPMP